MKRWPRRKLPSTAHLVPLYWTRLYNAITRSFVLHLLDPRRDEVEKIEGEVLVRLDGEMTDPPVYIP